MPEHLFICVGDPSADRHAARLVQSLRKRKPALNVTALGGDHLKAVADHFVFPLVGLGGFGFLEPLAKIPTLWSVLRQIKKIFREDPPQLVVPADYYGFNIHVAEAAKEAQIPVAYYISPQVWASRPGRVKRLAKAVTQMLVIFPFEKALYEKAGVPVEFVGHPLLDLLPPPTLPSSPRTLGLLPGSRPSTILRHLPVYIATAIRLRKQFPDLQFLMFRPSEVDPKTYNLVAERAPWIRLSDETDYRERKTLSAALTVSGTAALETMLLGIPMVVMYKLSPMTYHIARHLIRVPYVGIPNLLAGRKIVPELLQGEATPDSLATALTPLLSNTAQARAMRAELLTLRSTLEQGGTEKTAEEILRLLEASARSGESKVHRSAGGIG